MGRLSGTPLGAAAPVLDGLGDERRDAVAAGLLDTMLDQVLIHGIFHVDLHPGNLLVDRRRLASACSTSARSAGSTRPPARRSASCSARSGRGDSVAVSDALLQLVDRPDEVDERELQRAVGALIVRYAAPGSTAGAAAVAALLRTFASHGLGVPPPVAAVFRAFATLEGTLGLLRPGFDLVGHARAAGEPADRRGARRRTGCAASLEDELAALLPVLRRLPAADRPDRRRAGARAAAVQRPAVRRRAGPPAGHRAGPPGPADGDRRGGRRDGGASARRRRRSPGQRHGRTCSRCSATAC